VRVTSVDIEPGLQAPPSALAAAVADSVRVLPADDRCHQFVAEQQLQALLSLLTYSGASG